MKKLPTVNLGVLDQIAPIAGRQTKKTYQTWRSEVVRAIAQKLSLSGEVAHEQMRSLEEGPYALVPSPRELFEAGEPVDVFVHCVTNEEG